MSSQLVLNIITAFDQGTTITMPALTGAELRVLLQALANAKVTN
jgi:hypothetical protein